MDRKTRYFWVVHGCGCLIVKKEGRWSIVFDYKFEALEILFSDQGSLAVKMLRVMLENDHNMTVFKLLGLANLKAAICQPWKDSSNLTGKTIFFWKTKTLRTIKTIFQLVLAK